MVQKSPISGRNANAEAVTAARTEFLTLVLKQEFVGADQSSLHSVHHHGSGVVHPKFGHDVLAMGGDGMCAQEQFISHLSIGHTL